MNYRPKCCRYKTNSVDRPVKVRQYLRLNSVKASDVLKEGDLQEFLEKL